MKALGSFLLLLAVGATAWMGYRYVFQVPNWDYGFFAPSTVELPKSFGKPEEPNSASAPASISTPKTQPCPDCQGNGTVPCTAKNCDHGKIPCPGPCLKASVGKWEKLDVKGHSPDELWQVFRYQGGWTAWTQAHIGQVIDQSSGKPVNIGRCTICNGTSFVSCPECKGKGVVTCKTCHGTKVVPIKEEVPAPPVETAPAEVPTETVNPSVPAPQSTP